MSELNRVIEDRLAAAESAIAAALLLAAAAQSSADAVSARIFVGSLAPLSPEDGMLWSDTGSNTIKFWNGDSWLSVTPA